jgi:3-hydroxyacyl-[acyl-carrier-protein] dehydratase
MTAITNDIFSIDSITHENGIISAILGINTQSEIFKGHFPGQPVVPGACMLQVVKDVLQNALSTGFQLKKAGNLKFVSMIVPSLNDMIQLELTYKFIDDTTVSANAKLISNDVICFKFQGSFVKIG